MQISYQSSYVKCNFILPLVFMLQHRSYKIMKQTKVVKLMMPTAKVEKFNELEHFRT